MACRFLKSLPQMSQEWLADLRHIPVLKVLLAALPYVGYLLMFSFNKQVRHITHLETVAPPHIIFLSHLEHTLFFCYPHRILSSLANPLFDIIAGVPYLFHFPLPFLFIFYLAISKNRRDAALPFLWCVGWVNLVAVIIQTTFPTAPPWYCDNTVEDQFGNIVYEAPSEGGFSRLDRLFGINLFHGLYSTSPLKFGAFPSLHVALPMVVFLNHPWVGKKFGAFHVVLITLSALYITHHYLVDALAGILLACIVRLSILKIWSPFDELKEIKESRTSKVPDPEEIV